MEVAQMDPVISNEQRNDRLAQKARDTLKRCGNCAQTSFAVLQEEFSLEGGPILRALTPFPGVALRGETCGAVIGSLMAIGMVYGRDSLDDWRGYIDPSPPRGGFVGSLRNKMAAPRAMRSWKPNSVGSTIWQIRLRHLNMPHPEAPKPAEGL